jgi:DNA modification methylase
MSLYYRDDQVTLYRGDALAVACELNDGSVDCIVTLPPYFELRDYGIDGQYGLESSPAEYVETMRALFAELRRVLADDGTLWLNIGDSYNAYNGNRGPSATGFSRNDPLPALPKGAGLTTKALPAKNLIGIPWRLAFALQDDGWILRNDIVWAKPNGMPESVKDRFARKHEYIFLFSKSQRYWFDLDVVRVPHADVSIARSRRNSSLNLDVGYPGSPATLTRACAPNGKNPGDVWYPSAEGDLWSMTTQPFPEAHFATFPPELPRRCILAGCKPGGTVLDPFHGSGTTGMVARELGRSYIGIDVNETYLDMSLRSPKRLAQRDDAKGA